MLKILAVLNQYKWYAVAVGFLVYSVGVWNVSAGLERAVSTKKELERTELILKTTQYNQNLAKDISKALQEALAANATQNKALTKELLNEISNDPRYRDCRVTDGVRNNLKRKLGSQPK